MRSTDRVKVNRPYIYRSYRENVNKQRVICDRISESRNSHISSSVMAESVRQVATSAILVSQQTVVIHNAIVALQQDRDGKRQEQVERKKTLARSSWQVVLTRQQPFSYWPFCFGLLLSH